MSFSGEDASLPPSRPASNAHVVTFGPGHTELTGEVPQSYPSRDARHTGLVKHLMSNIVDLDHHVEPLSTALVKTAGQPQEQQDTLLGRFAKEMPKLDATYTRAKSLMTDKEKKAAERQVWYAKTIAYLDEAWGGRSWLPAGVACTGINVAQSMRTITKLAAKHRISLASLWAPDGVLTLRYLGSSNPPHLTPVVLRLALDDLRETLQLAPTAPARPLCGGEADGRDSPVATAEPGLPGMGPSRDIGADDGSSALAEVAVPTTADPEHHHSDFEDDASSQHGSAGNSESFGEFAGFNENDDDQDGDGETDLELPRRCVNPNNTSFDDSLMLDSLAGNTEPPPRTTETCGDKCRACDLPATEHAAPDVVLLASPSPKSSPMEPSCQGDSTALRSSAAVEQAPEALATERSDTARRSGSDSQRQSSLEQLESGRQLRDDTIYTIANVILYRCSAKHGVSATVVDPLWLEVDSGPLPNHLPLVKKEINLLFIPLHHRIPTQHWTLLVLDTEAGTAQHYDSLLSPTRFAKIREAVLPLLKQAFPTKSFSLQSIKCPQQDDGESCGIFVLAFLRRLIQGDAIPNAISPADERAHLATLLEDPLKHSWAGPAVPAEGTASHGPAEWEPIDSNITTRRPAKRLRREDSEPSASSRHERNRPSEMPHPLPFTFTPSHDDHLKLGFSGELCRNSKATTSEIAVQAPLSSHTSSGPPLNVIREGDNDTADLDESSDGQFDVLVAALRRQLDQGEPTSSRDHLQERLTALQTQLSHQSACLDDRSRDMRELEVRATRAKELSERNGTEAGQARAWISHSIASRPQISRPSASEDTLQLRPPDDENKAYPTRAGTVIDATVVMLQGMLARIDQDATDDKRKAEELMAAAVKAKELHEEARVVVEDTQRQISKAERAMERAKLKDALRAALNLEGPPPSSAV